MYEEGHIKNPPKEDPRKESPNLYRDLEWIWKAFTSLSTTRVVNESGPQRIRYSDLLSYLELTGRIDQDDKQKAMRLIPPLDEYYVNYIHKEREKEFKKLQSKAKQNGRNA